MLSWKQRPQDNGVGDAGADLRIDGQGQGLHELRVAEEDQVVGGWKILQDYPYLQPEDIRACLEYAAQEVDHPVLVVSGQ